MNPQPLLDTAGVSMHGKTPITLITGFLGSGKTTLLRRIVQRIQRPMAVVMNEFGEIAIDSKVVQGEHIQVVELAGGCVCCSLTGEFEAAVKEILEMLRPELIVVEATGVSDADALVLEVEDNLPEVRLDSVVHIVDAYLSTRHPYVSRTAQTHMELADIVLINKVDLVTTGELKEVETQVRLHNERALLFKTVGCDVDPDLLLGLNMQEWHAPKIHGAEEGLQSVTFVTDALLDEARFRETITALGPSVYRAKGFVRFPGASLLFNYVLGRVDLEEHEAEVTELVFIGPNLERLRDVIVGRLRDCEVRDAL